MNAADAQKASPRQQRSAAHHSRASDRLGAGRSLLPPRSKAGLDEEMSLSLPAFLRIYSAWVPQTASRSELGHS